MNQNEFLNQQQAAVERMREMNSRSAFAQNSQHKMPPVPSFVKVTESRNNSGSIPFNQPPQKESPQRNTAPAPQNSNIRNSNQNGFNIPFLGNLLSDADSALIIGLLLILMSENADKRLLFALVYILL